MGTDLLCAAAAGQCFDIVLWASACLCGEHGTLAVQDVGFVEATFDAALAVGQLLAYLRLHSKSL